jgi:tRNA pseudouridine38-40 synthase
MPRIALGLEYDGSQFKGWQKQTAVPSVQETLEKALSAVAGTGTDASIHTICAGRTDTGVHATGQVVHFDTLVERSERAWVMGANTLLTDAVRVLWARKVPDTFNARQSATSRRYRYVIYNHAIRPSLLRQYVSWCYRKLDIDSMAKASQYWLGEHDFSSFRAAGCQSRTVVRKMIAIRVVRAKEQVIVEFTANAFLHHMVRNMVGVLLAIGTGRAAPEWAAEVLEARDRRQAGVTAAPTGLYLVEVQYPKHYGLPVDAVGPWFLKQNEESVLI